MSNSTSQPSRWVTAALPVARSGSCDGDEGALQVYPATFRLGVRLLRRSKLTHHFHAAEVSAPSQHVQALLAWRAQWALWLHTYSVMSVLAESPSVGGAPSELQAEPYNLVWIYRKWSYGFIVYIISSSYI